MASRSSASTSSKRVRTRTCSASATATASAGKAPAPRSSRRTPGSMSPSSATGMMRSSTSTARREAGHRRAARSRTTPIRTSSWARGIIPAATSTACSATCASTARPSPPPRSAPGERPGVAGAPLTGWHAHVCVGMSAGLGAGKEPGHAHADVGMPPRTADEGGEDRRGVSICPVLLRRCPALKRMGERRPGEPGLLCPLFWWASRPGSFRETSTPRGKS